MRHVTQAEKDSMYNTPNTFGIWLISSWRNGQSQGGLSYCIDECLQAQRLYDAIEANPLCTFHADEQSRSLMNVTFRMKTPSKNTRLWRSQPPRTSWGSKVTAASAA